MNSLLDDNKKLCLSSGEIIPLKADTSVIFEPLDLAVASPATVSRCGMIYMESSCMNWRFLLESWVNTLPSHLREEDKKRIFDLFECIEDLLRFIKR